MLIKEHFFNTYIIYTRINIYFNIYTYRYLLSSYLQIFESRDVYVIFHKNIFY